MIRTNNQIEITISKYEIVNVPVMRNGKPTKRMKKGWKETKHKSIAVGILVENKEVFICEDDLKKADKAECWYNAKAVCYKADGSVLKCNCQFGRYGKADHVEVVYYNIKRNCFTVSTNGYDGACGVGAGAYIKEILW